ncbi:MAG: PRC-barrel domain containing protein, partial [Hyphomonadaceae bacterium]
TGWAFVLFAFSSIAWIAAATVGKESAALWQNIVLLAVNLFGTYRWLIRKPKEAASNAEFAPDAAP